MKRGRSLPRRRLELLFLIAAAAVAVATLLLSFRTSFSAAAPLASRGARMRTGESVRSVGEGDAAARIDAVPRRAAAVDDTPQGDLSSPGTGPSAPADSQKVEWPTPSPRPTEMSPSAASEALAALVGAHTPEAGGHGKPRQRVRRRRLPPRLPDAEAALAACEAWGAGEAAREARVAAARSTAARRIAAERVAARRRAATAAATSADVSGSKKSQASSASGDRDQQEAAEEEDEGLAAKRASGLRTWHGAMEESLILGGNALHRRPRGHVTHGKSAEDLDGKLKAAASEFDDLKAAEEAADAEAAAGEEHAQEERERLLRSAGPPSLMAAREALASDRARLEAAAWRASTQDSSVSSAKSTSKQSGRRLPGGRNAVSAFVDGVGNDGSGDAPPLVLENSSDGAGECGCPLLSDVPYPGWSFDCGEWDARILADLAPWWAADNNKGDYAGGVHAEGAPPVTSELLLHAWRTPMGVARSAVRPSMLLSIDASGRLRARTRNSFAVRHDDAVLSMLHTVAASVALPPNTSFLLSIWDVPATPRDDPLPVFHLVRSAASLGGTLPHPYRWDFGRGDFDIQPQPMQGQGPAKAEAIVAGADGREGVSGPPADDALSRVRAYQQADAAALAVAAGGALQSDEASDVEAALHLLAPQPSSPSVATSEQATGAARPRTIADDVCPPWAERPEHRVTWRGGCVGPVRGYAPEAYHIYLRSRAGAASRAHPELLDVGLTFDCSKDGPALKQAAERRARIGGINADAEATAAASPFPKLPLVSFEPADTCRYRETLLLDGNSISARSSMLFASGLLVYKPDAPFSEWYYHLLRPWIHYVPVRERLEDLHETVLFMRSQPRLSACIAGNAALFARRYLNRATAACYTWRLLSAWRSLHAPPEGIVATEDDLAAATAAIARGQHYIDGEDDVIED